MITKPLVQRLPSDVFVQGTTYDPTAADRWRRWLSPAERRRMDGFGAKSRRREFLSGRVAARKLLSARLEVSPSKVPLRRASDEAVDVIGEDWRLSIAHSGPHAVAACACHPLGVDLEHIEPRDPAIARFLFAPGDRGLIGALPYDADAALILCWTLKEATLKARRSGFRMSPKDLQLTVEPNQNAARIEVENGARWSIWYAQLKGYWSALAVPASSEETRENGS